MRHAKIAACTALGAILAVPSIALAIDLLTAGGYLFDIQDTYFGDLSNGTGDAYDGAYYLDVNGTRYTSTGASTTSLAGRNVIMPVVTIGSLSVHREVYVPATGGDFGRYLDVIANPGASAATVSVTISGNLGSDSGTVLYASASGDTSFTTADAWFGTDDVDASGDPSLAHVLQGSSARVGASAASLVSDNFSWTFNTSIPAGGRIAVLTFAVQTGSRAAAMTEAVRLAEAPDDALAGLDDYLDDIVNFSIAEPGAPRIRFSGPFAIEEGEAALVDITVEDLEGDPVSFSWDLDDDGTFGEMAGATSYTIPAGSTDGDGIVRVGVSASDGTNVTERYRSITVTNVAPTITSSPELLTSVGASYRYQIELDDPGAAFEEFAYTVTAGPSSMVISDTGLLSWTPRETDVTPIDDPLSIAISVSDGDMGTATQSWELTVSPNRAPSPPTPVYPVDLSTENLMPRLVAANGSDPDRDPLQYFFQIDTSDTFDSPSLRESAAIAQTPGYSFWQLDEALAPGRHYWRVWVNDGTVDSEPEVASFYVLGETGAVRDAGPGADGGTVPSDGSALEARARDDSGCAAHPGARPPAGLWVLLLLLAWRMRRRASTMTGP